MSQKFVKSILNAFGPHLQHLEFNECHELNLADLVVCPLLESLHITKWNTLDGKQYGFSFTTSEFLPQLKSVESGICLSGCWRYFEGITTLTRIVLYCCHIGTGVRTFLSIFLFKSFYVISAFIFRLVRILTGATFPICGL